MRVICVLFSAAAIASGCATAPERPEEVARHAMVTELVPEKAAEYVDLHANAWPEVLAAMEACNIRNFSIYLAEIEANRPMLFAYFEYWGNDFDADMAKMQTYDVNHRWWALTDACQRPVPLHRGEGRWLMMEEVFHSD